MSYFVAKLRFTVDLFEISSAFPNGTGCAISVLILHLIALDKSLKKLITTAVRIVFLVISEICLQNRNLKTWLDHQTQYRVSYFKI
jgi:hydroxymethylpyrimidine/phosphomethylpyrimidine kinase